jgi:sugar (pentulose or hexulose) kinase
VTQALIGLDVGTTTVTGVLFDTGTKKVLRLARRRNDTGISQTQPTRAEQDPRRLCQRAFEVLAELAEVDHPVAGLTLTGQMHGLLCVAASGEPLTPLITWQDQRTAEPLADGTTTLAQLQERLVGLNWQDNGCQIQHGYGGTTLFWLARQSKLPPATRGVCSVAHWLAGQLTGQPPACDPSFAASWGIYDVVHRTWNGVFLDRLGLDAAILPQVLPAGQLLGGLDAEIAWRVGLPAGLPVYNPLGDNPASFLGSTVGPGPSPARTVLLNIGTGGQVCWAVPGFEAPSKQVETRPLDQGDFLRVGASLCGGEAYAWLNRTVRSWLAVFDVHTDEETVYEALNRLAASRENTAGLHMRTTFQGVRGDPEVEAGAIEGIPVECLDLGALARATLQGIVDELYDLYAGHGGLQAGHQRILVAGGAVERNPLLPVLIEERFGLPVQKPVFEETAAVGATTLIGGPASVLPLARRAGPVDWPRRPVSGG